MFVLTREGVFFSEGKNTLIVQDRHCLRQENMSFIRRFFLYCVFNTECPLSEVPLCS